MSGARLSVLILALGLASLSAPIASAQEQNFVQLYISQRPLSPNPVPLSADGTAVVTSTVFSASTTNGTILTLEKVLQNGQFFFPHQVLRTYTIQFTATAPLLVVLGDQGTLFMNAAILGQSQNVLVSLGNSVPSTNDQPPRGASCSLSQGPGAASSLPDVLVLALILPVLWNEKRPGREGRSA